MSHEKPIGTGLVTITSDYEYVLDYMRANLLKFQADFSGGGWTRQELDIISHELENTAKFFAEEQGLNNTSIPEVSVNGTNIEIQTGITGNLYNSIKSRIHGESVILSANAKNSRNQYYAGHIEYGFHDRGGNFVEARPFLRPALYAVSESSKGRIIYTMRELLQSLWVEGGYMGYSNITSFGRLRRPSGGLRTFYNQPRYGSKSGHHTTSFFRKGSLNSKGDNFRKQLRKGRIRKGFSEDRYDRQRKHRDDASFKTKTGRTRPRIVKNVTPKQKRLNLKRRRRRENRQKLEDYRLKQDALRRMKNHQPLKNSQTKFFTDHELMRYRDLLKEERDQAGTTRNWKEEQERAKANRNKNKKPFPYWATFQ